MQRMRSKLKISIECGIEFLENHSLEFNEIWHENTSEINGEEFWTFQWTFNKGKQNRFKGLFTFLDVAMTTARTWV